MLVAVCPAAEQHGNCLALEYGVYVSHQLSLSGILGGLTAIAFVSDVPWRADRKDQPGERASRFIELITGSFSLPSGLQ